VVFPDERGEPAPGPGDGPVVIGMSGNLSYAPNVLGFETFATEIVPAIRREISPRVVVVGSSPRRSVLRRADASGIEVHADVASVPRKLGELGVSVLISPQQISAGFPNRIVDAVYRAGLPVVASRQTLEGAPRELAALTPVAETEEGWVRETLALLAEPRRREAIVALQSRIDALCAPEVVVTELISAYEEAAAPR
jgi:glycosyl transferase family 1